MRKGKFPDVNLSPQVLVDCVTVCVLMHVYIFIFVGVFLCVCARVCVCLCMCVGVFSSVAILHMYFFMKCVCEHNILKACTTVCMHVCVYTCRLMIHMDVKEVIPQQRTPGYWPTV